MLHVEPLFPENHEALQLYRLIGTQVSVDLHLASVFLPRVLEDRNLEEITGIMERFEVIHASTRRIAESQPKA